MSDLTRRDLLKFGLGVGTSMSAMSAGNDDAGADSVFSGQLGGFVIGKVQQQDATYFDALANTGARLGRIFLPFSKCRDCDKYGLAYEVRESLKHIIDLAGARGLQLVVVGEFPGSDRPDFWSNPALRESFVEKWQLFARAFGNNPAIAGLDLLNEPNPPWPGGNLADAHALWRPLAEQAIHAIRGENVQLPVIYEGVAGGASLGLRGLEPLQDSQVLYSIHCYTPHEITHQHVNSAWTRTIPYPAGPEWGLGKWDAEIGVTAWNRRRMELDLRDTISFQRRYQVPIYVGEFSCVRWAPNRSRERYIADCLATFKRFGWSWTYHEFRGWPGWDAEIDSEDRAFTTRSIDAPAMSLLRSALNEATIRTGRRPIMTIS